MGSGGGAPPGLARPPPLTSTRSEPNALGLPRRAVSPMHVATLGRSASASRPPEDVAPDEALEPFSLDAAAAGSPWGGAARAAAAAEQWGELPGAAPEPLEPFEAEEAAARAPRARRAPRAPRGTLHLDYRDAVRPSRQALWAPRPHPARRG